MYRYVLTLLLAGASAVYAATAAYALDERTFKISQVFPSTHWHNVQGIQTFIKLVDEASGGKIKFEVYHAGQLGKETSTVVNSGLADIGILVPIY